jgi:outer membrane protein OmpA-like peptidoglycan-associated protein
MNKLKIFTLSIVSFLVFISFSTTAQQSATLYYMENAPVRNSLNPAFQPLSEMYIGFYPIGFNQLKVGATPLSINDMIYFRNGQNSFLNPFAFNGMSNFYNNSKSPTLMGNSAQINFINMGFRTADTYTTLSVSQRMESDIRIPVDFKKLALLGNTESQNGIYNFNTLGYNLTSYLEIAFGSSTIIDQKLTLGGKAKILIGQLKVKGKNNTLDLNVESNQWSLKGQGEATVSGPFGFPEDGMGQVIPAVEKSLPTFIKPYGVGIGLDFGAVYKLDDKITLSAAITDLGFISWRVDAKKIAYNIDYKSVNPGDFSTPAKLTDAVFTGSKSSSNQNEIAPFTSFTNANLNLGGEYGFKDSTMSVGLFSRTMFRYKSVYEEFTPSYNYHPNEWLNVSTSLSFLNFRLSNLGLGLGLRTYFLHWLLSTNYIPQSYASKGNVISPYNPSGMNVSLALNFVIGNPEYDFKRKKDVDNDGIPDYLDKCPDTPIASRRKVDKNGCLLDSDKDGVPDYLDKCAKTPAAAIGKVDSVGCPLDTDGDGVADYLDKCPGTPLEANGRVDVHGCLTDTDKDGVPDYLDECDTPASAIGKVDSVGCPLDTDGDGVPDYVDKCPKTPVAAKGFVDDNGCPIDSDADGVPDYMDNCPTIAGVADNEGCPEIKKEVKVLFQKALEGIQFETGKVSIDPSSFALLDQIFRVLIENPGYLIDIRGHTDNSGAPAVNLKLSESRADAVRNYLIKKGVSKKRISSQGMGDSKPIADNETEEGRAKNRRVEFVVIFEENAKE